MSVSNVITGFFTRKTGKYLEPIWIGMFIMTLGFGLFIDLNVNSTISEIVIFQLVAGIGIGPCFQSPLIALQTLVHPNDVATATSTLGFVRNVARAMSIVIGGVVFNQGMQAHAPSLRLALGPAVAAKLSGGNAEASVMVVGTLPTAEQRYIARKAYANSLKYMWVLYVCVSAVGLVASGFIGKHTLSTDYVETKTGLGVGEALQTQDGIVEANHELEVRETDTTSV
ncbi:MAG: hypothetical protein M1819_000634 [Sarea resinae]|nr:MAG: hypothetical protein M1819_000634 [Sarea resinae]